MPCAPACSGVHNLSQLLQARDPARQPSIPSVVSAARDKQCHLTAAKLGAGRIAGNCVYKVVEEIRLDRFAVEKCDHATALAGPHGRGEVVPACRIFATSIRFGRVADTDEGKIIGNASIEASTQLWAAAALILSCSFLVCSEGGVGAEPSLGSWCSSRGTILFRSLYPP
jgi:hypothetical protein